MSSGPTDASRLIEYLVGWSREAPILIVGLAAAAPDRYPLASSSQADPIALEPSSEPDAQSLLDAPARRCRGQPAMLARIHAGGRGEPALRGADAGDGDQTALPLPIAQMPPSIHALLAAVSIGSIPTERAVIERASVVGRDFWRGSCCAELSPSDEHDELALAR